MTGSEKKKKERRFFFGKKKQKTFVRLAGAVRRHQPSL
jgi:hypothetical protein